MYRFKKWNSRNKQSIQSEDYDSSKMLKYEIERLRDAALSFDTDRLLTPIHRLQPPMAYQKISGEIIETEAELIEQSIKDLQEIDDHDAYDDYIQNDLEVRTAKHSERPIRPAAPDLYSGNYDFEKIEQERLEEEKRIKERINDKSSLRNENFKNEQDFDDEEMTFSEKGDEIDLERRAGNLGQPIDFSTVNDDKKEEFLKEQEEKLKELDDIPTDKRELSDALGQILDEDILKHIFSQKWQQREKGYEMANGYTLSILQKSDDVGATQKLLFQLIQEGLEDKIIQIQQGAMKICATYLSAGVKSSTKPINETTEFENIIVLVFDKLAIAKITSNAKELVMKMISSDLVNLVSFIDFMFTPPSFYLEGKGRKSFAHLTPRFEIVKQVMNNLSQLSRTNRITKENFPLRHLQDRLSDATKSNNKNLRELTKDIIL